MKHYALHGGAWFFYQKYCQVTYTLQDHPDFYDDVLGFRLIKTIKQ
jgi:formylglycine-generating enzyme required for sulfatase activity